MQKLLLSVIIPCLVWGQSLQEHSISRTALNELCKCLGIDTQGDLIAHTQKQWLRKAGQERWHIAELPPEQRQFVLTWAKQEGFLDPWLPTSQQYDIAVVLGASTKAMEHRLGFLCNLWNTGTRFQKVVWLVGNRPLDAQVDTRLPNCHTEADAAHAIWDRTELPSELRALPISFIALPMIPHHNGFRRPTTEDTIVAFNQQVSKDLRCLFISDQPHCYYQHAVIKKNRSPSVTFDVAGEGIDPDQDPNLAAVILDMLARSIYVQGIPE